MNKPISQIIKSKKFIAVAALLVALAVVITGTFWWLNSDSRVVIEVGGEEVTRGDVNTRQDILASFYDYFGDGDFTDSELQDMALDSLIMYYALTQEAQERGMPVTDEEMEAKFAENAALHDVPIEQFEDMMLKAYGFDRDDLEMNYTIQILQDKLTSHLLQHRDILRLIVRYDVFETGDTSQDIAEEEIRQLLEQDYLPLFEQGETAGAIIASTDINSETPAQSYDEVDADYPTIGSIRTELNRDAQPDYFLDTTEWDDIYALKDIGDHTGVERSDDGGYYYIYRLENITNGDHASWDDYLEYVKNNSNYSGIGRLSRESSRILSYFEVNSVSASVLCGGEDISDRVSLADRVKMLLVPESVYAQTCSGTSDAHLSGWTGTVTTTGGVSPAGVDISIEPRDGWPQESWQWCGGATSGSATTNTSGLYSTGLNYSCFMQWQATFSKPNCTPVTRNLILQVGDNGALVGGQDVTLTCIPPTIDVIGSRVATGDLTQTYINNRNVRINGSLVGTGASFSVSGEDAGNVYVQASDGPVGDSIQIRIGTRVGSSGGYSYTGWSNGYQSTNRNTDPGDTLYVRVEYREPPLPPQSSASGSCTSYSGSINLDYTGTASVRFKAWLQGDPEPAGWQQERWFGNGYGTQANYEFTVPDVYKDAYRETNIRVRHMYSPRNENNHDGFNGSVGLCGDYFLYEPSLNTITNEDDRGNRKPGQNFTVRTSVYNNGLDRSGVRRTGFNYDYELVITQGAEFVDPLNSLTLARPGIQTGATDTVPGRNFRIVDDAPHGAEVCFRVEIDPTEGQSWPASGARVVQEASQSNTECFNVYNEQFELSAITLVGDGDYVTPPPGGESLTIRVRVVNNGDVTNSPAPINNAGAIGGVSSGVETRLQVYSRSSSESNWGSPIASTTSGTQVVRGTGGTETITYSFSIPQNTSEDTIYCFVASANPVSGWSDGSNWGGAPFNDNPAPVNTGDISNCQNETRVTTQPYFQTHRNDIHSGVSYARPDSPLRGCEPINTSRGFIDAARTNSFGSLGEYAAYATGPIVTGGFSGFGSSAASTNSPSLAAEAFFTSSPMSERLTFANQGTRGNLGASAVRCMSNLYEMLEKTDGVYSIGTTTLSNFGGSLGNPATVDVQAYRNGDLILDTGGGGFGSFNRRVTIIVNGDLYIERNLSNYNPAGQHFGGNLIFIVRGDINIHERVTNIDALLYAIPNEDTGSGGAIDTCHNRTALGTDVCQDQLIINGAVVADRLDLKRTHGGISSGRDQEPAEVFRFSPLHYLVPPYFVFSEDAPRPDLEIQQMIDLPPRF